MGRKDSSISESKLDDTSEEEDGSSADEESEVEIRRPSRSGKSKVSVVYNDACVRYFNFHCL